MTRRYAQFDLSVLLFLQALAMPEDTAVYKMAVDPFNQTIRVIVSHPDLAEVAEGSDAPLIYPELTLIDETHKPSNYFSFDWNQKNGKKD